MADRTTVIMYACSRCRRNYADENLANNCPNCKAAKEEFRKLLPEYKLLRAKIQSLCPHDKKEFMKEESGMMGGYRAERVYICVDCNQKITQM